MDNRWAVLALLFAVRLGMAFQFQSVASVSPLVMREFGVDLGNIGILIGLYLAPGLVFALPGGEIGRRFGDKSVVLLGLALMVAGGLVMMLAPTWNGQLAGRLVAGVGGVLLNVLMSKMVTDWFAGKELATAMAIFVNSWPVGIALALVALPPIVTWGGLAGVHLACVVFATGGLVLLWAMYKPANGAPGTSGSSTWPTGRALQAVIAAGIIWGLFNAALGMIFGFGTAMLAEQGWSLAAAGSAISLVLWLVGLSVPLGGVLADRTGRPNLVMLGGFALFAVALVIAARTQFVIPAFVVLGLVSGLSAGPIMSLPARVLDARSRAAGMGLYFTMFYLLTVAGPIAAGKLATVAGTSAVAFDIGAAMLAACFPCFWAFERLRAQHAAVPPAA
jgi:MFS family permease